MITLEDLEGLIFGMGVDVRYKNLHKQHPLLDAYAWPARRLIVLDETLRYPSRHKKCVLAEEIGHMVYPPAGDHILYHTADYYNLDSWQRFDLWRRVAADEREALQWATGFLIPDTAFWDFLKRGPHEWEDWLEYFDVEDWFMGLKFRFIKKRHYSKWTEIIQKIVEETAG
ncbi:ImmA/IrrE family metallo-endopeptidase [Desulfofundulus sp.]|uniref:ImmA/IrrE family metallo-endopeptidase n=1 Tax=Desulfofundulus sp. TaxID=2282750 RepID=UPI003C717C07